MSKKSTPGTWDLPVRDATSDFTFRVRVEDSDNADPRNDHACAIALAIGHRRGVYGISVGPSAIYVRRANYIERFIHSAETKRNIDKLDGGFWFPPGMYTIKAPTPSRSLGAATHHRATGTGPRTGDRKKLTAPERRQPVRRVSAP